MCGRTPVVSLASLQTLTPTIDINMLRPRDAARLRVVDLDRAFGSAATGRSEDVDDDEVLVSDDKALAEENRTLLVFTMSPVNGVHSACTENEALFVRCGGQLGSCVSRSL